MKLTLRCGLRGIIMLFVAHVCYRVLPFTSLAVGSYFTTVLTKRYLTQLHIGLKVYHIFSKSSFVLHFFLQSKPLVELICLFFRTLNDDCQNWSKTIQTNVSGTRSQLIQLSASAGPCESRNGGLFEKPICI